MVIGAAKGGVGKTTLASLVASRAAEHGGLNVVLMDANRGQGDVTSYLRVDLSRIPTVYDAAVSKDPAAAVASPEKLNAARNQYLDDLDFALVAAPPPEFTDPTVVTAGVYSNVLSYVRSKADLVVVDTQIMEDSDTSGLVDHLVVPVLVSGGWFLAASDMSRPSVENVRRRLERFGRAGVAPDRMLLLFNRVHSDSDVDRTSLSQLFTGMAHLIGTVPADPELADAMNVGKLPHGHVTLAPLLDDALRRVTGLDRFTPEAPTPDQRRGRFLSRFRRR